jgi:GH18 family chitinase
MRRRSFNSLWITAFIMLSIVTQSCQQSSKYPVEKEQCIMAYYVPGNLDVNKLPLQQLTHIIYSFTEVRDNQMVWVNGPKVERSGGSPKAISALKSDGGLWWLGRFWWLLRDVPS